jgi:hypothetical protein
VLEKADGQQDSLPRALGPGKARPPRQVLFSKSRNVAKSRESGPNVAKSRELGRNGAAASGECCQVP